MGDQSKRQNERFPCDIAATLHTPSSGAEVGRARLTDLAIEGAAVETTVPLVRRVPYEVRWSWKGADFRVVARVAWDKPARGGESAHRFGLSFTTTSEQEALLRQMTDALRQQLWSHRGPR